MRLLVFALCIVFSTAQVPHPCESPKEFEGRFSKFDPERKLVVFGKFSYDETYRRFREFEFMEVGSEKEFYDKLFLYDEGVKYTVNLRTRICNKTVLTRPFRPFGVPPDARFRGTYVMGPTNVGMEHVSINIFDGKTQEGDSYFVETTEEDCFPITFTINDQKTGKPDDRNFYDISLGISDPMAFDPPRNCPQ